MGFFSKLKKSLNPVNLIKNPKQAVSYAFDPAGTAVRAGRGAPMTLRTGLDPGGLANPGQTIPAPNSYQPSSRRLQLSPAAQQLMADMQARAAARAAGQAYQGGTRGGAPVTPTTTPRPVATTPTVQGAPSGGLLGRAVHMVRSQQPQSQQPNVGISDPRQLMGRVALMADGGKVTGKARNTPLAGCEHYESKSFNRKPNGKKC